MERKTNLKQVKNCSEDPRFLKLKLFQLIGWVKNICIGSFFNVAVINALFDFLFVLRYSTLDFCLYETFIYHKKWCWFSSLQDFILTVVFSPLKQLLKINCTIFWSTADIPTTNIVFIIAHYEGKQSP